jgi:hypothetical protein
MMNYSTIDSHGYVLEPPDLWVNWTETVLAAVLGTGAKRFYGLQIS